MSFYRRNYYHRPVYNYVSAEKRHEILSIIDDLLRLPEQYTEAVLDECGEYYKWASTFKFLSDTKDKASRFPNMFASTAEAVEKTAARFTDEALKRVAKDAVAGRSWTDIYKNDPVMQDSFKRVVAYYSNTSYYSSMIDKVRSAGIENYVPSRREYDVFVSNNKYAQKLLDSAQSSPKFKQGDTVVLGSLGKNQLILEMVGLIPGPYELASSLSRVPFAATSRLDMKSHNLMVLLPNVHPVSARAGSKRVLVMDLYTTKQFLVEERMFKHAPKAKKATVSVIDEEN